jgi:hypothetical protein
MTRVRTCARSVVRVSIACAPHLTGIAGGSRRDAAARDALAAVLDVLAAAGEALSGRAVKDALEDSEHPRAAVELALRLGVRTGALSKRDGPRRSKLYTASVPVSRSVPSVSQDSSVQCPAAYIERDTRTLPDSVPTEKSVGTLTTPAATGSQGEPFTFDPSQAFGSRNGR